MTLGAPARAIQDASLPSSCRWRVRGCATRCRSLFLQRLNYEWLADSGVELRRGLQRLNHFFLWCANTQGAHGIQRPQRHIVTRSDCIKRILRLPNLIIGLDPKQASAI